MGRPPNVQHGHDEEHGLVAKQCQPPPHLVSSSEASAGADLYDGVEMQEMRGSDRKGRTRGVVQRTKVQARLEQDGKGWELDLESRAVG